MAEVSYSSSSKGAQQERPKSEVFNEKFDQMVKFASTSLTRAKQVSERRKETQIMAFSLAYKYNKCI